MPDATISFELLEGLVAKMAEEGSWVDKGGGERDATGVGYIYA